MQELLCNALKLYRNFPTRFPNDFCWGIVTLDPKTGFAEPATNRGGLIVLGHFEGFTKDGNVIAKSGVFICENSKHPTMKIGLEDIGKLCGIEGKRSVCKLKNKTSQTIAGVVRNVCPEGIVVEIGNVVL